MSQTIFITGTSTGLGRLTARVFAERGWNVAATMRDLGKAEEPAKFRNVKYLQLDVADVDQVKAATADAITAFGKVDVVVNNAGMGTFGALELAEESAIDWQYSVNVRGPINIIRSFLPHFRAHRGGMFINISSFMGLTTAMPLASLYNMSKFALEGLTEALYYELEPLNIDLRLIEQGGSSDNNFVRNIAWNTSETIRDYDVLTSKVKARLETAKEGDLDDPQMIVDAIYALATRESTQFRTVLGSTGNTLMALRHSVPIEDYLARMASAF